MKIGYARTSTDDQNLDLQIRALKAAGCDQIFEDAGISGGIAPMERPGFQAALAAMPPQSVFVVWKLDRLGRSLSSVIETIDALKALSVQFISLTEKIDTTTAMGRAFWQITGVFAELERNIIQERTRQGLEAARARGQTLGRPRKLNPQQVDHAKREIAAGRETLGGMSQILGVDRGTLRRALSRKR